MASLCFSCFLTSRVYGLVDYFFMTGCRNFFLRFYNFVAYRTADSCCFSCFLTGRCYGFIDHLCMTQGRDFFCFGSLAFCTGVTLLAFLCAGWISKDFSLFPVMSCCRNHFLELKDLSTDRTVLSFGFSIFSAGWLYGLICYLGMACCRDFLFISKNLMAGAAVYHCVSWFLTGCGFCYQFCFRMADYWYLFLRFYNFSTDLTVASFGFSWCFAGRCYCFICHFAVTGCRDFFMFL